MPYRRRARTPVGHARVTLAAVVVVSVTLVGFLVGRSAATSSAHRGAVPTVTVGTMPLPSAPGPLDRLPRDHQRGLSEADGVVPAGVTVFDNGYPAIAKLDPT